MFHNLDAHEFFRDEDDVDDNGDDFLELDSGIHHLSSKFGLVEGSQLVVVVVVQHCNRGCLLRLCSLIEKIYILV